MVDAKKYALIDLHIHLDGSLSLASARALADMQGIALPEDDETLLRMLRVSDNCQSLNEYLEKFALPLTLLQTSEAISEAVLRLCRELAEQGLAYAEIRFAPQLHCEQGLTQGAVVEAAIRGMKKSGFYASLILCCMRGGDNLQKNLLTVEVASRFLGKGVCAIDLAGAEALYSTDSFAEVFEYARSLSIPFTVHAGEADGPESVYAALSFGARRIGHGVRSIENPELLQILSQKKIALELCPTSNMNTRVFETMSQYPIRAFLNAGMLITINTDNTSVSATSLANEYQKITDTFSLTESELQTLALNSAYATFLCDVEKEKLVERIKSRF